MDSVIYLLNNRGLTNRGQFLTKVFGAPIWRPCQSLVLLRKAQETKRATMFAFDRLILLPQLQRVPFKSKAKQTLRDERADKLFTPQHAIFVEREVFVLVMPSNTV